MVACEHRVCRYIRLHGQANKPNRHLNSADFYQEVHLLQRLLVVKGAVGRGEEPRLRDDDRSLEGPDRRELNSALVEHVSAEYVVKEERVVGKLTFGDQACPAVVDVRTPGPPDRRGLECWFPSPSFSARF